MTRRLEEAWSGGMHYNDVVTFDVTSGRPSLVEVSRHYILSKYFIIDKEFYLIFLKWRTLELQVFHLFFLVTKEFASGLAVLLSQRKGIINIRFSDTRTEVAHIAYRHL